MADGSRHAEAPRALLHAQFGPSGAGGLTDFGLHLYSLWWRAREEPQYPWPRLLADLADAAGRRLGRAAYFVQHTWALSAANHSGSAEDRQVLRPVLQQALSVLSDEGAPSLRDYARAIESAERGSLGRSEAPRLGVCPP